MAGCLHQAWDAHEADLSDDHPPSLQGEAEGGPEDLTALLSTVHQRLSGSIMVVWDGLPAHVRAATRAFINAHTDWLLVYRFPAYAPELKLAEGAWACPRDKPLNLAADGINQLTLVIRSKLKQMQYQPALLDGFVAETGLSLSLQPKPGGSQSGRGRRR
ncbi:transposase [Streptosporangium sp. NPDC049046]|uniref:transposase n=1 Tax=Streptosporangium sp. NPDC049046 TaxID=3155031 RepID=UPI00343E9838